MAVVMVVGMEEGGGASFALLPTASIDRRMLAYATLTFKTSISVALTGFCFLLKSSFSRTRAIIHF